MSSVQSIERAFEVLGALVDGPIGVTEVAERSGLPKSTAARLLRALAATGAVEQVPDGTDYRLGPRMVSLAAGVRPTRSLVGLARPILVELAAASGEAAGLSIPDGFSVHYVDQVDTSHPVGVRDWTGTRLPMHAVSSGRVFLAHLHPAELDRALVAPLERFTSHTEVDAAALRAIVRAVQVAGVAWTADEYAEGITSVAAPVVDGDGDVIAAVHIHGPSYRFPGAAPRDGAEVAVRDAAARVSARLRHD